jgi:hypothetical protein
MTMVLVMNMCLCLCNDASTGEVSEGRNVRLGRAGFKSPTVVLFHSLLKRHAGEAMAERRKHAHGLVHVQSPVE